MNDANAPGQRRRGRRPKANKRVPLSLLVDPELRSRLIDAAEANGRSITRQTELMLKQGFTVFISHSSHDKPAMSEVLLGWPSAAMTIASVMRPLYSAVAARLNRSYAGSHLVKSS